MINVSNAFKENIKNNVRHLDGFVELIVGRVGYFRNDENYGSGIEASSDNDATEVTMGNINSVIDDKPIMYKYASLESNRLLLDGSFILPSKIYPNKNCGYIGDNVLGTGSLDIIAPSVSSAMLRFRNEKKITIYFEEGYATDFTINVDTNYYNSIEGNYTKTYTYSITDNEKENIVIDFNDIEENITVNNKEYVYTTIMKINIEINSWSNENRRVRIRQINIGETLLLENRDIIEINVNEQTSLDNTDMPNNDFNVTLNNYDRRFYLLNSNSILNRLNTISTIHPFIGVSLNKGSIEYVNMGIYNFSSYEDNQNKTITLYGEGIKSSFEKKDNYLLLYGNSEQTASSVLSNMGVLNNLNYNGVIELKRTNTENEREQLQSIAIFTSSYIKETRTYVSSLSNKLSIEKLLSTPLEKITLKEQIKEPKITRENKIKVLKINSIQIGSLDQTEKTLLEDTLNIQSSTIIKLSSTNPIDLSSLKIYLKDVQGNEILVTSPTFDYFIENSYFMPRITINNLDGSNYVGVKVLGKEYNQTNMQTIIGNEENGSELEYNNEYIFQSYHKSRIAKYVLNNQKDYYFRIEFNGDPSLEVGDAITFETVDGDMIGNIEKINLRYNGGLQETIEGVCNSVL